MSDSQEKPEAVDQSAVEANSIGKSTDSLNTPTTRELEEARRWWIKLILQPVLLLAVGALLIVGLGVAQRFGFISSSGGQASAVAGGESTRYICPMMCTPPQTEPGRCPVCAMELVPATSGGSDAGSKSIQIDRAARRVANIRTVAAEVVPLSRTIRAIGELSYDEGTQKTIAAYVDGRIERLFADYTGVVVEKGDHLALVYSPQLYSGQVELLLAKKAINDSRSATLQRVIQSNRDLYESARQRLVELGMTDAQIEQLEQAGEANSRMHLCAPISGTVIEKLAVEGQYVKEGQPIYKLADLSSIWFMLELFPEDAAVIRYGQKVEAEVQSLPGRKFTGRVAFVDPNVDPQTRTVGVRVVMPNEGGELRIGDYATATIDVQLGEMAEGQCEDLYDPELAGKFISPRHPHVVSDAPGNCPVCGIKLVPASKLGYSDLPIHRAALVVPRNAVLVVGNTSVVYVEAETGRFEIRRVVLGHRCGDRVVVLSGVEPGEAVATSGNFLIDSQMQLAGNPSLIDPSKAMPMENQPLPKEMLAVLAKLPEKDRALAEDQRICPVTEEFLGSMGMPKKVDVEGKPVFICCEGCRESLLAEPQKYLKRLAARQESGGAGETPQPDLPPIGLPELIEPDQGLPPIEAPQPLTEDGQSTEQISGAPAAGVGGGPGKVAP